MPANIPALRLTLADGTDLADKIKPRFIDLTLTEKRADESDELNLTLHNHDGALAPVRRGAVINLALGWQSGDDVPLGLVDKGAFTVDEVEESGPPHIVTIRARAADLNGANRIRRHRAWKDTNLGAIVSEIAAADGKVAAVHPDLASIPVAAIEQGSKSNKLFLRDLGQRYDAVATWKNLILIFMPVGAEQTASGLTLPRFNWTPESGGRWRFAEVGGKDYNGAKAQYHDQDAAQTITVESTGPNTGTSGGGSGDAKLLKKTYATRADAQAAANAEAGRQQRGIFSFEYELALGDAAIAPNGRATLTGWSSRIDAINWLVDEATHSFGSGGLHTSVKLESAG